MHKAFHLFYTITIIFLLSCCASTPIAFTSVNINAEKATNQRTVKSIIKKYNMENINFDKINQLHYDCKITELIIAKGHNADDIISYCSFITPYNERARFAYVSINGEKTSCIKIDFKLSPSGTATAYLNNYNSSCLFQNKGRSIAWGNQKRIMRELAYYREFIKFNIAFNYGSIRFDEKINPKQAEIIDPRNIERHL